MLEFFATQSPLANFLTIVTGVIGLLSLCVAFSKKLRRWLKSRFLPETFSKLITKHRLDQVSNESLRKVARIAVIDDHLEDIPLNELKAYGFNVDPYVSISLSDSERFKIYDIIFLDVNGVVKEDLELGGAKLLPFLRRNNSRQKICAISHKKYSAASSKYFLAADEVLDKPLTSRDCISLIEEFLEEKLMPTIIASKLDASLTSVSKKSRKNLIGDFLKKIPLDPAAAGFVDLKKTHAFLSREQELKLLDLMRVAKNELA
ncbi:hypothetical protein KHO49_25375 [Pseudomonas sp. RC4D1]|uniref:hypothetical protein n=1 Tax=Pseudomonas sp. RC4D1 TaxID=2834407 RepID=UPI001BCAE240|nr:hypothetical protein [Pseudomonas sp. RC4D1]MBS7561670.1 hypothetical protein [Pseudomonas sp. RC4D1]